MNKYEAIMRVSELADSHVGTREGYNNDNPFAQDPEVIKAYGGSINNLPWCDIFYDYLFCKCFGAENAKQMTYQTKDMSAACKRSYENYKRNGAIFTVPEEGDQAFFYSGDGINHTGYVRNVSNNEFLTIEGNSSDMVARRTYQFGNKSVAGFGRPNWNVVASQEENEEHEADKNEINDENNHVSWFWKIFGKIPSNYTAESENAYTLNPDEHIALQKGDGMNAPRDDVKAIQNLLRYHGIGLIADGEFGNDTEFAVKVFQEKKVINPTGKVDIGTLLQLIKRR